MLIFGVALFFNACSTPVREDLESDDCNRCVSVNPEWLQKIIDCNPDEVNNNNFEKSAENTLYLGKYSNVVDRWQRPLPEMGELSSPIANVENIDGADNKIIEKYFEASVVSIPSEGIVVSPKNIEETEKRTNITVNNNMFDEKAPGEILSQVEALSYIEKIYN